MLLRNWSEAMWQRDQPYGNFSFRWGLSFLLGSFGYISAVLGLIPSGQGDRKNKKFYFCFFGVLALLVAAWGILSKCHPVRQQCAYWYETKFKDLCKRKWSKAVSRHLLLLLETCPPYMGLVLMKLSTEFDWMVQGWLGLGYLISPAVLLFCEEKSLRCRHTASEMLVGMSASMLVDVSFAHVISEEEQHKKKCWVPVVLGGLACYVIHHLYTYYTGEALEEDDGSSGRGDGHGRGRGHIQLGTSIAGRGRASGGRHGGELA